MQKAELPQIHCSRHEAKPRLPISIQPASILPSRAQNTVNGKSSRWNSKQPFRVETGRVSPAHSKMLQIGSILPIPYRRPARPESCRTKGCQSRPFKHASWGLQNGKARGEAGRKSGFPIYSAYDIQKRDNTNNIYAKEAHHTMILFSHAW